MNTLITLTAKYLFVPIIIAGLGVLAAEYKKRGTKEAYIWLAAAVLALLLTAFGGAIYNDPRPFVVTGKPPLFPHPADNGFPSDHTIITSLVGLLVFAYRKTLGVILIAGAVLGGISRVLAGVHHTTDIIGGILIALVAYLVGHGLVKRFIA